MRGSWDIGTYRRSTSGRLGSCRRSRRLPRRRSAFHRNMLGTVGSCRRSPRLARHRSSFRRSTYPRHCTYPDLRAATVCDALSDATPNYPRAPCLSRALLPATTHATGATAGARIMVLAVGSPTYNVCCRCCRLPCRFRSCNSGPRCSSRTSLVWCTSRLFRARRP